MKLLSKSPLKKSNKNQLPLIPLRELVIFPYSVVPFFAGRPATIKAIEQAMEGDKNLFLAFQKNKNDNPTPEDLYPVGTIAHILQILKLPDGSLRVLVEGRMRADMAKVFQKNEMANVSFKHISEPGAPTKIETSLMTTIKNSFKEYTKLTKKVPGEILANIEKAENPDKLISLVCTNLKLSAEKKMEFLIGKENKSRLENLAVTIEMENEVITLKNNINGRVKMKLEKTQKEYFLNEQLKEIQKELGSEDNDPSGSKELEEKILALDLPEEVQTKALKELKRLARLQPMSPESGVLRTYLEWITDLPWGITTEDNKSLRSAADILDKDHYDLKKAKDRILDFIAVRQLKEHLKGPILCFAGPPGTGKTSLGRSVAKALNREFIRISLGGVRDEAEIRGHRKTYVGALPGKIIQSLKKAKTENPVFLLDEIDKMNSDFRGDPGAALLEVLDPEQNSTFVDHYLEVPFDLSKVMFITTANSIYNIPRALMDRMEIINIPGYTDYEKLEIASRFIFPKQLEENGLEKAGITMDDEAILKIIRSHTMESGVRSLEREISQVIRKITRKAIVDYQSRGGRYVINTAAMHEHQQSYSVKEIDNYSTIDIPSIKLHITADMIEQFLGKEKFAESDMKSEKKSGMAIGLAWTEMGGRVLPVEVKLFEGSGKLILTGKLGDVMKESAQIAFSFLRSNADTFGISPTFSKDQDIHIHVPEGAIPKDGPSAGITMTAALLSAIKNIPLKSGIAMTGEITLTDRLLPIGGLKEKALAAHRNKLYTVIIPAKNKDDMEELPQEILDVMTFHAFSSVKEALVKLFPKNTFKK
ncbi:MAG: endopeptidase La [Spirochaetaceae bacterium]|nr:endopeptidase La [Spirochaetaceae bacterium]